MRGTERAYRREDGGRDCGGGADEVRVCVFEVADLGVEGLEVGVRGQAPGGPVGGRDEEDGSGGDGVLVVDGLGDHVA